MLAVRVIVTSLSCAINRVGLILPRGWMTESKAAITGVVLVKVILSEVCQRDQFVTFFCCFLRE